MSQKPWEIREALKFENTWLVGLVFLLLTGWALSWIFRRFPLIERYLEHTVMVTSYLAIALIIFWGVIGGDV